MCRTTKQLLGVGLAAAGVGMALALLISSTFLSVLLAIGLIAGGLLLWNN